VVTKSAFKTLHYTLILWPDMVQNRFHNIYNITHQKLKQMTYQWDPCFTSPAPNLFRVIQIVVTISENDEGHMTVSKLVTVLSSICDQNRNYYVIMSFPKPNPTIINIKNKVKTIMRACELLNNTYQLSGLNGAEA